MRPHLAWASGGFKVLVREEDAAAGGLGSRIERTRIDLPEGRARTSIDELDEPVAALRVARALLRAASTLVSMRGPRVETSLDTARKSARATGPAFRPVVIST